MIAVPLPPGINLQGEDAEVFAYILISDKIHKTKILDNIDEVSKKWMNILLDHFDNDDLVLRTFLIKTKDFKEKYCNPSLMKIYQNLKLPKYIWITEISIPELFCQFRMRFGEVITDPTASPALGDVFLSLHLPGIFITRDVNTEKIKYLFIPDDKPYTHIIR